MRIWEQTSYMGTVWTYGIIFRSWYLLISSGCLWLSLAPLNLNLNVCLPPYDVTPYHLSCGVKGELGCGEEITLPQVSDEHHNGGCRHSRAKSWDIPPVRNEGSKNVNSNRGRWVVGVLLLMPTEQMRRETLFESKGQTSTAALSRQALRVENIEQTDFCVL